MQVTSFDNPEVQVTAVYFRGQRDQGRFESFPRRMVYDGREYSFLEDGLRYLVQKGQDFIKLFDVSDGQTDYRLRQDNDNRWTLVGMRASS